MPDSIFIQAATRRRGPHHEPECGGRCGGGSCVEGFWTVDHEPLTETQEAQRQVHIAYAQQVRELHAERQSVRVDDYADVIEDLAGVINDLTEGYKLELADERASNKEINLDAKPFGSAQRLGDASTVRRIAKAAARAVVVLALRGSGGESES